MKMMNWKVVFRYGLIGGVVALYFSMVGMVETFSERQLIGNFLNLGHLLLYGGVAAAGLLAARAQESEKPAVHGVAGLVAGFIASLLPIALIVISGLIDIRSMFVQVSPGLINFLTFSQPGIVGLFTLAAVFGLVSLLAALYTSVDERVRGSLGAAFVWTIALAVFSDLLTQIIANLFGRAALNLFFDAEAFKPWVAILLFGVLAGIFFFRQYRSQAEESSTAAPMNAVEAKKQSLRKQMIQFGVIGLVLIIAPWILGSFLSQVLFEVGRFALLGLGLNIVVGYAGLLDLGYVAFFAFGAYTMGILTTTGALNIGGGFFNFWLALPIAVLVGVAFGILLGFPVLRMRGDYLAIVTLGFGEIIRILALSDWLSPIMGGAQGVLKIPNPVIFGLELASPQLMYYLVLAASLLAAFISLRLRDSRLGRQWMAMREDEDVAEAMGINLVQTKLMAFAIGAGFSALGGAIFASRLSNIFPHSFNILISINALSLIIVGGLGSIPGVILGAIALVGLPELLRQFAEYRLLMYGILLTVMMLLRPEGLLPNEVSKREFHASEDSNLNVDAEA